MTPHQIAALIFGLAGHEAIALDIAGQNVILDEVHVYSEQTQAMVLELVKALVRLGCRVHIGSATIPSALADELRRCLGGTEAVYEVRLSRAELATYDRHIVHKLEDEDAAREYVKRAHSGRQARSVYFQPCCLRSGEVSVGTKNLTRMFPSCWCIAVFGVETEQRSKSKLKDLKKAMAPASCVPHRSSKSALTFPLILLSQTAPRWIA